MYITLGLYYAYRCPSYFNNANHHVHCSVPFLVPVGCCIILVWEYTLTFLRQDFIITLLLQNFVIHSWSLLAKELIIEWETRVNTFKSCWFPFKKGHEKRRVVEKAMVPHSSTLAWKIPWTEEPGRLQSMRSRRVGHDWATSLSLLTFMRWRRKWQPTPVFLPGESQERRNLVGCRLWGRTESDTTEAT